MRINKYLRECAIASRRKAEELVTQGAVCVNGIRVTDLSTLIDPDKDIVTLYGEPVRPFEKKLYIMLNKPRFYVTTRSDEHSRATVMDLIDLKTYLTPVGRLDYDTEGLLLLSNDGDFVQRIQNPRHHISKTYIAGIRGEINRSQISEITQGMDLQGGLKTRPCKAEIIKGTKGFSEVKITIYEGKNRQVRRMLEHFSLDVVSLKRIAIGNVTLGTLPSGKWRHLNQAEVSRIFMAKKRI